MDSNIIMEALKKHEDGIMQFTLGDIVDEYGEKYCNVYKYEWENHSESIASSIDIIMNSNIPLNPNIIVGIILSEWFVSMGCDNEDLNYYGLLGVAIEIINHIESYYVRITNKLTYNKGLDLYEKQH